MLPFRIQSKNITASGATKAAAVSSIAAYHASAGGTVELYDGADDTGTLLWKMYIGSGLFNRTEFPIPIDIPKRQVYVKLTTVTNVSFSYIPAEASTNFAAAGMA